MADDIFERFTKLSTAIISDVMRAAGAPHSVLKSGIAPLTPGQTIAGPAFCVKGEVILGNVPKREGLNPRFEMFRMVRPGAIVIVESGGYETSVVFGGNIVNSFRMQGCCGVVTDGGVRDRREIERMDIPVFCRFVSPLSSGGEWAITRLQTPLSMLGQSSASVTVIPGDVIVADDDGAIVIPARAARTILEDSERLIELEADIESGLNAGRDPGEVFASISRFSHVRQLEQPGAE